MIEVCLDKIKEAKLLRRDLVVQVDGGVTEANLDLVLRADADNVVMGSAIFENRDSPEVVVKRILKNTKSTQ